MLDLCRRWVDRYSHTRKMRANTNAIIPMAMPALAPELIPDAGVGVAPVVGLASVVFGLSGLEVMSAQVFIDEILSGIY